MNEFENSTVTAAEDDWGDIDLSDLADTEEKTVPETEEAAAQDSETESEADQQNDGEVAEAETESDTQPVEEYTLKHLGEEQKVNREEVIALAQQGLDHRQL